MEFERLADTVICTPSFRLFVKTISEIRGFKVIWFENRIVLKELLTYMKSLEFSLFSSWSRLTVSKMIANSLNPFTKPFYMH